ncbi:hypothetical protein NK6_4113 [Bradyrhizobium diazoefficiens]|uniref:Uncharacterized protein n=1 Tax=Bradyrhizobium diazoefficiens TaxID=1355477 RepID=A0A0E4BQA8_9BRAD|nr:hypothetical protein NK6_4113 [Bradyrhizobium diazoefficiens]
MEAEEDLRGKIKTDAGEIERQSPGIYAISE